MRTSFHASTIPSSFFAEARVGIATTTAGIQTGMFWGELSSKLTMDFERYTTCYATEKSLEKAELKHG